ncbi:cytoplasmic protein, partial [Salmonella enterica subsp. enterica serovar Newport]
MTETSSHRYKQRNIINAPKEKTSNFSRSQKRGDSENNQRWLSKQYYRWIIGDFPHVYP